jgi:hypothetical protein
MHNLPTVFDLTDQFSGGPGHGAEEIQPHVRKGICGNWRQHFTTLAKAAVQRTV